MASSTSSINIFMEQSPQTEVNTSRRRRCCWPVRSCCWVSAQRITPSNEWYLSSLIVLIAGLYTMIIIGSPTNQPFLWGVGFLWTCAGLGGLYFDGETVDRLVGGAIRDAARNFFEDRLAE